MPPLVVLRGRETREWTVTDRILAVALTLSADLVCSGCGQPKHESYNPDSDGWYEVHDAVCNACAEVEKDAKANSDHDHSRKAWVVDTRPPDQPLRDWNPR